MGPLVYTSGNMLPAVVTVFRTECFNGAAGLHQRKPNGLSQLPQRLLAASMGPLVYTSGNWAGPQRT